MPSHEHVTLLASAARTADVASTDQKNTRGHRGVRVFIDVTVDPASASVVFSIEGKTPGSAYHSLLDSAAVTAVGLTVLELYPGIAAVANLAKSGFLPLTWRVNANHADTDSITYSVTAEALP